MKPNSLPLGENLRAAMDKSGMSRKQIAAVSGINVQKIQRILKSDDVSVKALQKITNAIHVPIEEFIDLRVEERIIKVENDLLQKQVIIDTLQEQIKFRDIHLDVLQGLLKIVAGDELFKAKSFTLITKTETKKITLDEIISLVNKAMALAKKAPNRDRRYLSYLSKLFNILEIRRLHAENEHLLPPEIRRALLGPNSKHADSEYIDYRELWKSLK